MNDKLSDFDFDYDSSGNSVSDFYFHLAYDSPSGVDAALPAIV